MDLPSSRLGSDAPVVWGVLNVTPDSFSDGGRFASVDQAVDHGRRMFEMGADVIDVGGESTRPGAERISVEQELDRVLPVVTGLIAAGVPVSVDTMRSRVAAAACEHGASIVYDVSGGLADDEMIRTVAQLRVPYVAMHWRGQSRTMDDKASYVDPVAEVISELTERVHVAREGGIDPSKIIIDPGFGFAKNPEQNWAVLRNVDRLAVIDQPVLIGASRKRFLGALLSDESGIMRPVEERDVATAAISAMVTQRGVWGVRVHDVGATVDAIKVALAMMGRFGP